MNDSLSQTTEFLRGIEAALDPFGIGRACRDTALAWLQQPQQLAEAMTRLSADVLRVQAHAWKKAIGVDAEDVEPVSGFDERFQDPAWTAHPGFDALKEFYLLQTHWLQDAIFASPGLDTATTQRAAFWVRQVLDAIAPTNFFWTNPLAIAKAIESGGTTLRKGLTNFARDLATGDVLMVEPDAFRIGEELATTEGAVVFRNALLEVIQYTAQTPQVHARPVVLVAPWINKFYILDLKPRTSLVRYLVGKGHTVFVTSWRNAGPEARDTGFEDYLMHGVRAAIDTARAITGSPDVHAIGYCLGGTALATLMAWYAAGDEPCPVAHWTLFTTLTDFSDPGEIGVFLTPDTVRYIERNMRRKGYLDGAEMARSFRLLRPNSLIWHYVVHSYLYGADLPPFDVLFWNMDTTRMPAAMHGWYLRELYLGNRLAKGELTLAGRRLDLGRVRQPLYAVGCEQDHIAPWKQTFRTCGLVGGPVRYALATSGHILGIINPPVDPPKRRYWVGDATGAGDGPAWLAGIAKVPGSWWDDWQPWLAQQSGELRAAPTLGDDAHPPLAPAPGTYVRLK